MARDKRQSYDVSVKVTRDRGADMNPEVRWMQVGRAFQQEDGKIILNLLTLPVRDSSWDGGLVLFPDV